LRARARASITTSGSSGFGRQPVGRRRREIPQSDEMINERVAKGELLAPPRVGERIICECSVLSLPIWRIRFATATRAEARGRPVLCDTGGGLCVRERNVLASTPLEHKKRPAAEHKKRPVFSLYDSEKACSSDSRFGRKLSGTTGHRLLGTQGP